AMAEAILRALKKAQLGLAPERFEEWFDPWFERLDTATRMPEAAASLFHSDDSSRDVVKLSVAEDGEWWAAFEPVLQRWAAKYKALPKRLAQHLREHLQGLAQQALREEVRKTDQGRGWIAWQQRFLEAIAKQTGE